MSAERLHSIAVPRTVAEPRPTRPARKVTPATRDRRDEGLFWIARQILRADTHGERATILLRIPDLVLTEKSAALAEACEACQFGDGVGYIAARAAATSATRGEDGLLPDDTIRQLEYWRRGLVAFAMGASS